MHTQLKLVQPTDILVFIYEAEHIFKEYDSLVCIKNVVLGI